MPSNPPSIAASSICPNSTVPQPPSSPPPASPQPDPRPLTRQHLSKTIASTGTNESQEILLGVGDGGNRPIDELLLGMHRVTSSPESPTRGTKRAALGDELDSMAEEAKKRRKMELAARKSNGSASSSERRNIPPLPPRSSGPLPQQQQQRQPVTSNPGQADRSQEQQEDVIRSPRSPPNASRRRSPTSRGGQR